MKARELYNRGQGGRFPSFELCSDFRVHDTSPAKPENKIQLINQYQIVEKMYKKKKNLKIGRCYSCVAHTCCSRFAHFKQSCQRNKPALSTRSNAN